MAARRGEGVFFAQRGEPLKVQLIEEKTEGQRDVSCYTIKDRDTFVDFCVGPQRASTGKLKAFKLLSTRRLLERRRAQSADGSGSMGTAFLSTRAQGVPDAD